VSSAAMKPSPCTEAAGSAKTAATAGLRMKREESRVRAVRAVGPFHPKRNSELISG
jgi:hypothetical protein